MRPIIQAFELISLLENKDLIIVDASNGPNALQNYKEAHLNGAILIDLETELSTVPKNAKNGGRHPLPATKKFAKTLSKAGMSPDSHVVIYDDKNGANAAARLWWMLRAVGHEKVQVLNGGLFEAEKLGFPVNNKIVQVEKTNYPAKAWQLPIVDLEEVEMAAQAEDKTVIDVRGEARYRGEIEPIDLVAGHIPGAINIPLTKNLDSNGYFKSSEDLNEMYSEVMNRQEIDDVIVHCGSGVTACHTILAMDYAGLGIPKLYVGSWSEWSRNNKPIGKV